MGASLDTDETGGTCADTQLSVGPREPAQLEVDSLGATQTSGVPTPPTRPAQLGVGEAIGRYVVLGTLGAGGMGVVHAAYDPELDRKLAIKLLHGAEAGGRHRAEIRARLLREAQAIAKLNHQNVVGVHDVGLHDDQVFVAMEFVDGGTLGEWMKSAGSQPRPWPEVLERFLPAGRGLAAAHAAGLVHRDFKPANVLLGRDGRPRVADFGIARSIEGGETHELEAVVLASETTGPRLNELLATSGTLTRTGVLIGTPAYMAPEQFSDAQVDARADQFAFCVALHEALYGVRPFAGATLHALIAAIIEGRVREPPRGTKVPSWLRKIVLRGLATEPSERWPDMNALLSALEQRPRRKGRLAAVASLGLALAAAVSAAIVSEDHTRAELPVCTEVDDALGQTWSTRARAAVAQRAVELGADRDLAADRALGAGVVARLDRWAQDWRAGWVDACEATHVRGEQSSALLDRRMSCLQRQRRRVEAYTELFVAADDEQLRKVSAGLDELVEDVGDPRRCADTHALMAGVAAPERAEQRGRVEVLAADLDQVYAALVAGEWVLARTELEALEAPVREADWPPLTAELAYLQAELHAGTRELEASELGYRRAFIEALKIGDEALAAKARRDLANLIAEWDSRHDEALEHLRVAEALAIHLGDTELEGSVALSQATTLELRGDFEDALAAVHRGAEAMAAVHGPGSTRLADARYRESMALYRLGRIDEARAALAEAEAGFGDAYGPQHPIALKMLNGAGVIALGVGDWQRAEQRFTELLARKQVIFGPDHLDVSDALSNLGAAQYNAGHLDAARISQERALAIREREMGADNLYVGHSLANLAVLYGRLERPDQAMDAARRAFEIIAEVRGARHHDTMVAHSLVGETALLAGDDQAALLEFRAAVGLAFELGSPLQQLEFSLQVALCLVHLDELDAASRELDAIEPRLDADTVLPVQRLLYEYLRARVATARGQLDAATEHRARARALLDEARHSGVGAITEAEAWLTEPTL